MTQPLRRTQGKESTPASLISAEIENAGVTRAGIQLMGACRLIGTGPIHHQVRQPSLPWSDHLDRVYCALERRHMDRDSAAGFR